MKTGIPTNGSMVKNHISLKNGIRIHCNTENFVPIVVPGLSTSSSSSLPSSTSMTPTRQEIDHPTSSSSSSTSPTMTSSIVSSDSVARQARGDLCGIDSYPVTVSSKHVERQERGDLCSSGTPEEQLLTKPTKNPKPNKNEDHDQERGDLCHSDIPEWPLEFRENLVDDRVPEHRDSHASSSHEVSLEPTPARSADWVNTVFILTSLKTEIARSVRGPRLQGAPYRRRNGGAVPRAENVGDLITADHKVLSENCESRNNHRYAVVVSGLGHSMDPVVFVQNKSFTGNPEKLVKVLGSPWET